MTPQPRTAFRPVVRPELALAVVLRDADIGCEAHGHSAQHMASDHAEDAGNIIAALAKFGLAIEAEAALPPSGDLIDLLSRASNRLDLYQTHDEDCPRPIAGAQCPCSHGQLMREIDAALTETEPRP